MIDSKKLSNYKLDFKKQGFVILKNVINKKNIEDFCRSLAYLINACNVKNVNIENIQKKSSHSLKKEILSNLLILEKKDHKYISIIYDTIRDLSVIEKIYNNEKIISVVHKLLGINTDAPIYIKQKACRIDMPKNTDFSLEWHQESPYTIKDSNLIQIWAPAVDNIKKINGAIKILPGSHQKGHLKTNDFFPKVGHAQYVPDEKVIKKFKVMNVEMNLGDVLLFSKFLIHKSGNNNSELPRLTFIGHYHDPANKKFFENFFYKGDKAIKKNSYT